MSGVCVDLSTVEGLCLGVLIHLSSSVIDQSHPPSYPWSSLAVDHAHWSLTDTTCPHACLRPMQKGSRDKLDKSRELYRSNVHF